MTKEELQATRAYVERRTAEIVSRLDNPNNLPPWAKKQLYELDSIERIAVNCYNAIQERNKYKEAYERLTDLFRIVENAFFAFIPFRHRFTGYTEKVGACHVSTLTLMSVFSMLPKSDEHRRELLITMINEHIRHNSEEGSSHRKFADFTRPENRKAI